MYYYDSWKLHKPILHNEIIILTFNSFTRFFGHVCRISHNQEVFICLTSNKRKSSEPLPLKILTPLSGMMIYEIAAD